MTSKVGSAKHQAAQAAHNAQMRALLDGYEDLKARRDLRARSWWARLLARMGR